MLYHWSFNERRFPLVGRLKNSWPDGVCQCVSQSVSVSVQAFSLIASERPVRSGPGCHRSTHRSAGTTMAPVRGRLAARGTWHVPPREGLQKLLTHLQVKQEAPPIRNWQVTRTLPQPVCFCGCRSSGVQAARARGGKLF